MLNLDTHILLFAIAGSLTAAEERLLTGDEWSMSAICLWEIAKLAQLRRVEVDLETPAFTRLLSRLQIWPLTLDVCRAIPRLDFRGDPADEIIAATSLVHRVPLLTRDRVIRGSRIVPFA
jgi:PIN domain nuclease of toxin-antitoxin system